MKKTVLFFIGILLFSYNSLAQTDFEQDNNLEDTHFEVVSNSGKTSISYDDLKTSIISSCLFAIWAEENGALVNNNFQWSFGNGATGNIALVLAVDCQLRHLSFSSEVSGTSISIDIVKNGSILETVSFTGNHKTIELNSSLLFQAGDRIGFRTNTEVGNYQDARVCSWFSPIN